jgi:CxxC motif-containing protein (DUF1111 family)
VISQIKIALVYISITLISACGGGSAEQGPTNPDTTPTNPDTTPTPEPDNSNHAFKIDLDDGLPPLLTDKPDVNEHLSADIASISIFTDDAFGQAIPAIVTQLEKDAVFKAGDHIFRSNHDGEGPIFNNTTCQGCHIKDGRGHTPSKISEPMTSMFFRVGDTEGNPDPIYGDQIQMFGHIDGQSGGVLAKYQGALNEGLAYGEAYTWIEYDIIEGKYADGESYTLRQPIYKVKDQAYGEFTDNVRFSARITPHVFGSGLLESIPEASLLAYEDPNDSNNDGISGRAAYSREPITGSKIIARFGQKAITGSVLQQVAGAYRGDMGVTTTLTPEEPCTNQQQACLDHAETENNRHHNGLDLNNIDLAQVEFYNRTLAVPKRRGFDTSTNTWDENILAGRSKFYEANCHICHVPRHKTGEAQGSLLGDVDLTQVKQTRTNIKALENLVIYPYTDLLLHDMGGSCVVSRETNQGASCTEGAECLYVQRCDGLSDGKPEGDATASEWKTAPLWGLGLVKVVNERATFLHDGRARSISEAILWHGGEAQKSKTAFTQMSKQDRTNLLAFLNSL